MARQVAFVDREGKFIEHRAWMAKSNNPTYWTVAQFDNGVVQVTLKWVGRIENPGNSYRDLWPVYILLVKNYKADGTLAVDPADSDKTFANEADGVKAYQEFLTKWTESKVDDSTGEFAEVGNTLELPKPPDPNQPVTESAELPGGAW